MYNANQSLGDFRLVHKSGRVQVSVSTYISARLRSHLGQDISQNVSDLLILNSSWIGRPSSFQLVLEITWGGLSQPQSPAEMMIRRAIETALVEAEVFLAPNIVCEDSPADVQTSSGVN